MKAVKRADILLSLLHDTVDRDVLTANPNLKAVSSMNITQDRIDLAAATELGIPVTNIPAIVTDATADIAFGLLLAAARNIALGDRLFRQGVYPGSQSNHLAGYAVSGKTLGLVGFGRIGQAVARRGGGFGMKIIYCDPRRLPAEEEQKFGAEYRSFEDLLREADYVSAIRNRRGAGEDAGGVGVSSVFGAEQRSREQTCSGHGKRPLLDAITVCSVLLRQGCRLH